MELSLPKLAPLTFCRTHYTTQVSTDEAISHVPTYLQQLGNPRRFSLEASGSEVDAILYAAYIARLLTDAGEFELIRVNFGPDSRYQPLEITAQNVQDSYLDFDQLLGLRVIFDLARVSIDGIGPIDPATHAAMRIGMVAFQAHQRSAPPEMVGDYS